MLPAVTTGVLSGLAILAASSSPLDRGVSLAGLLDEARLRVLRATVLICLLIAVGNLVGAIAGFTASGNVTGPATAMGAVWCVVWSLAAVFPKVTARAFARWRMAALVLASANAATIALTGGIDSPLLAVCMYAGWIASVVIAGRAALAVSLMITGSVFAGYLLAGDTLTDIFGGPYRYGAVTNAALPLFTGIVGVLLASVTNTVFSRLASTLDGLRVGMPATTPGLTALLAGRPILELPATSSGGDAQAVGSPFTEAEREIVRLLAAGNTPQQIARLRCVALSTVRSQIKAAKRKTGARTLAQLALWAE